MPYLARPLGQATPTCVLYERMVKRGSLRQTHLCRQPVHRLWRTRWSLWNGERKVSLRPKRSKRYVVIVEIQNKHTPSSEDNQLARKLDILYAHVLCAPYGANITRCRGEMEGRARRGYMASAIAFVVGPEFPLLKFASTSSSSSSQDDIEPKSDIDTVLSGVPKKNSQSYVSLPMGCEY